MNCGCKKCRPLTIINDRCCGVDVVSTCSNCCSKVCCRETYTGTITNNTSNTLRCASLHVPLDGVFCLDINTVTVNGQQVTVDCLDAILLGDIAPGENAGVRVGEGIVAHNAQGDQCEHHHPDDVRHTEKNRLILLHRRHPPSARRTRQSRSCSRQTCRNIHSYA